MERIFEWTAEFIKVKCNNSDTNQQLTKIISTGLFIQMIVDSVGYCTALNTSQWTVKWLKISRNALKSFDYLDSALQSNTPTGWVEGWYYYKAAPLLNSWKLQGILLLNTINDPQSVGFVFCVFMSRKITERPYSIL